MTTKDVLHPSLGERTSSPDTLANKSIELLKQSVAVGYSNVAHVKKDKDLDALRDREDFKKLMAELGEKVKVLTPPAPKNP